MKKVYFKPVALLCLIAMIFSIFSLPVSVMGAASTKLQDFNTALFDTSVWKAVDGGDITNVSAIATDLMPSGYAIQNTSGNILVYNTLADDKKFDFTQHDYYISFYYHMTGAVSTGTNSPQHVLAFYNSTGTEVAKAGIIYNSGYKPFVKMNGTTLYDGGATSATNIPASISKDKVYQFVIKVCGGSNPSMLMKVFDVGTGALVASPGKDTSITGTTSSQVIAKIGTNINSAWGGTQTISDLVVKEYTSSDKTAALKVYSDAAALVPDFGSLNATTGVREIGTDISSISLAQSSTGNGSTITWASSNTGIITNDGTVTHPAPGEPDAKVFLTATVTNGSAITERSVAVLVKAQQVSQDLQALINEREALTTAYDGKVIPASVPLTGTVEEGVTIGWECSDPGVTIDEAGNITAAVPTAMQGDREATLTATLSKGGEEITKDINVVIQASTGIMAVENFTGLMDGDMLTSEYTASQSNGFGGSWKKDRGLTQSLDDGLFIRNVPEGRVVQYYTTAIAGLEMYNVLRTPLDMDSDSVYYASWKQSFSNQGNDAAKYLKAGFTNGLSAEISSVWMASGTADKCRIGLKAGTATDYNADTNTTVNLGQLYSVVFKIVARSVGNDEIYLKIYPAGTQEPEGWTYSKTASLTGKYDRVFVSGNTAAEGDILRFGDFKAEKYNAPEATGLAASEAAMAAYIENGGTVPVLSGVIPGGIAQQSLANMLKLRDHLYFGEHTYAISGTRIFRLKEGTVTCSIDVVNDSGEEKSASGYFYATLYNEANGLLEDVKLVEINAANGTVPANSKITIPLEIKAITAEQLDQYIIKTMIWDEQMQPYTPAISIDSVSTKSY